MPMADSEAEQCENLAGGFAGGFCADAGGFGLFVPFFSKHKNVH
jgi:hypothetical protein